MISQDRLDRIRSYPIEDIIGSFIKLTKKGKEYTSCCPFHEENTPSFSISPNKGIYKCFGCGESGDAIKFVEKFHRVSFAEAVEDIEKRFGTLSSNSIAPRKQKKTPIPTEIKVFSDESVEKGMVFNPANPFHAFLAKQFPENHQALISRFVITTSTKYFFDQKVPKTAFWYRNRDGKYLNAKLVPYGTDGKRKKQKGNPDYDPFWAKSEADGYGKCLFGESLMGGFDKNAWIGIVESEKSVIICHHYYPNICWLGKGASTGLTEAKAQVLKDRKVLLFPDADGPGKAGQKGAESDAAILKYLASEIRIFNPFPDRNDKTDIADWFMTGEWTAGQMDAFLSPEPVATPEPDTETKEDQGPQQIWALEQLVIEWVHAGREREEATSVPNLQYLSHQFSELSSEQIKNTILSVYQERSEEAGMLKKDPFMAAQQFFARSYDFRENTINRERIYRRKNGPNKEWLELDEHELFTEMRNHGIKCSKGDVISILNRQSNFTKYDPIRDYFESLPAWDKTDHIEKVANLVKIKSFTHRTPDGHALSAQAFWISMFRKALIRHIECSVGRKDKRTGKTRHVPNRMVMSIISLQQEIGKSRFIQTICPPELQDYYSEEPLEPGKDTQQRIASCFIYNLEEYEPTKKVSVNFFKAMVSKSSSNIRIAYGRNSKRMERRCNFWATTNEPQFLQDSSNTRWLIFEVERFDPALWEMDVTQLWAQAYELFKQGYNSQLTDDEKYIRDQRNQEYEEADEYTELILGNFVPTPIGDGQFMSSSEMIAFINRNVNNKVQLAANTFGKKLNRLGFARDKPGPIYGYWFKFRSQMDIVLPVPLQNEVGF